MKFWEIYFTLVEVLKTRLTIYENMLEQVLTQHPQGVDRPVQRRASPRPTSKSVLVIEPLEKNRVLIARYLTALAVNVSFVTNEEEAVSRSAQEKFDLKINTTGMKFPEEKISLIEQVG